MSELPTAPGLCGICRYRRLNRSARGPVYLRCERATWDGRLTKYPRLPVLRCVGFEPDTRKREGRTPPE